MQTRGNGSQSRDGRTLLDHQRVENRETLDRVVEPEYYAGYRLLDPLGQKIGKVEKIFTSGRGEPQYIKVTTGWMGSRTLVIPTDRVAVDEALQTLTLL